MHCRFLTVVLVGTVWVVGLELPFIQEYRLLSTQVLFLEIPTPIVPSMFLGGGVSKERVVENDDLVIVIEHNVIEIQFSMSPIHDLQALDHLSNDVSDLLFGEQ